MKKLIVLFFSLNCLNGLSQVPITEDIDTTQQKKVSFILQYRNILFDTPKFYLNGRTSYFNFSANVKRFEFGVGLNPFGVGSYNKLSSNFEPTDEWISASNIWLLYLDLPLFYEVSPYLNINFGKLYVGLTPQILVAGESQFVTQLESPSVVHEYELYKNPSYMAFETKWNLRMAIEYRVTIHRNFEIGVNLMQNVRKIAPEYYQVNHSYFPSSEPKTVKRIGGIGLTVGFSF